MISAILKVIQMFYENIKKNKGRYLDFILYGFLIFFLLYYILVGSKALLNSDSSFIIDLSEDIIKYKTLFTTSWNHTNDFWFYSLIPLIIPLLKLGINIFMSRQIAVLIQTIFIFYLLYKIFYNKKDKSIFKIITLLILSGISAQVYFELFGDATYGSIVLYMLLALYLVIKNIEKPKKINCILLVILLTLITSCSLRFPIFIVAPLIVVLLLFSYKNGFKREYISLFIALIVGTLLGYVGNTILTNNLNLLNDVNNNLVENLDGFRNSFISTIYNYLTSFGATGTNLFTLTVTYNKNISSSSPLILLVFIKYVFAFMTTLIPFLLLKFYKKFNVREKVIYIYTFSVSFIIVFFGIIGNMLWYRYFIPISFFLVLLYGMFYKYFMCNNKKNRIIFWISLGVIILTNVYFNVKSIYSFSSSSFIDNYYQEVTDCLVKENLAVGYIYYKKEHNLFHLLSNGKLRIIRFNDESYKISNWLASNDWLEENYYNDKVFFMRKDGDKPFKYENKSINKIVCGEYLIFIYENNEIFRNYLKIL